MNTSSFEIKVHFVHHTAKGLEMLKCDHNKGIKTIVWQSLRRNGYRLIHLFPALPLLAKG